MHLIVEEHMIDNSFINSMKEYDPKIVLIKLKFSKTGGWKFFIDKLINFWINYLVLSFLALRSSKKKDILITWQVFVGVITGIMIRIFCLKRRLIILSFIYRPRNNRFINFIRLHITKYGLKSADKVICYSQYEMDTYNELFRFRKPKFYYVQLGRTYELNSYKGSEINKNYVFSAGQSNRDYDTLIKSMKFVNIDLIIATTNNLNIPSDIKENILVMQLANEKFQSALLNSILMVIPLDEIEYSSGQIVLINAMALGKCVIITETKWTKDYITHGENAWLVPPKNERALADAINNLLNDSKLRSSIGQKAQHYYNSKLNGKEFGKRIIEIIKN